MHRTIRILIAVLALGALLALPAAASAASTTQDVYGGLLGAQQGTGGGGGGGNAPVSAVAPSSDTQTTSAAGGNSLPFSGFEVGLASMLGLSLLGAGFLLRRRLASGGRFS